MNTNKKQITLTEFADKINVRIIIYRIPNYDSRDMPSGQHTIGQYTASFANAELMGGGIVFGYGDTPNDAMEDYARKISGGKVGFYARTPLHNNVEVPQLKSQASTESK